METNLNTNHNDRNEKEIDLKEIFDVLFNGKVIIGAITALFSIVAIIYSLLLPNVYQSKAILSPVGDINNSGISSVMKSVGGLASLAGVNTSPSNNANNAIKALEKLNTLSFFQENIMPSIFLPDLMAFDFWDASSKKSVYDKSLFDETTQTWVRGFDYPQNQVPSAQESYNIFVQHFRVSKDIETGFLTITVKHQSPVVAQAWAETIVSQINYFFRSKAKKEAEAATEYLNMQMALANFTEIKLVTAQLLQQKLQQLTVVEASDFYVFDIIEPPAVMERKSEPVRSLICIIGAFLGGLFGCLVVLIRHYAIGIKQ
ncbi:MAG: chain length determinant protein [Rickettsiales bacterium]|nr:chain length determinant protein [Rickettsiales bacterium]